MPYGSEEVVAPVSTPTGTPSPASSTALCNLALQELGQSPISSLTEASEAARTCTLNWPEVRDAVLRKFDWPCLKKRAQLARLTEVPAYGFAYMYRLPPDYFRMLELSVDSATWAIEGKALLTDQETVFISYISYDVGTDDCGLFDSLLRATIVAALALSLAPALKASKRIPELTVAHDRIEAQARAACAVEASRRIATCDTLLSVR